MILRKEVDMLFLAMYKRDAGHVDGETRIGLIEAKDERAGMEQVLKELRMDDDLYAHNRITLAPVGTMIQIATEKTKFED